MMRLKASSGKCLIEPSSFERLAVLIALPVPAQFTKIRSCPCAARALAKPASTLSSSVTLTSQNITADFSRNGFALFGLQIEQWRP